MDNNFNKTIIRICKEINSDSSDVTPDMPWEYMAKVESGSRRGALTCLEEGLGPYAEVDAFNVETKGANHIQFLTYNSIEVGTAFTCHSDPEIEKADHIRKTTEKNTRDALANQIKVALTFPKESALCATRYYETVAHNHVDHSGSALQKFDLCTLVKDSDKQVFSIRDINIETGELALSSIVENAVLLRVCSANDVILKSRSAEEQREFKRIEIIRPVFEYVDDMHQLDLAHHIDFLIKDEKHSISYTVDELCYRLLILLEVPKKQWTPGRYPARSIAQLDAGLAKIEILSACCRSADIAEWDNAFRMYGLLVKADEIIRSRMEKIMPDTYHKVLRRLP